MGLGRQCRFWELGIFHNLQKTDESCTFFLANKWAANVELC